MRNSLALSSVVLLSAAPRVYRAASRRPYAGSRRGSAATEHLLAKPRKPA